MSDDDLREVLRNRLADVERRIVAACARVQRPRSSVTLIAVTKTVSPRVAGLLSELGVLDLGENRPQELWRKADALTHLPIRWHMIGHLQRNKIDRTLPLVTLFHSIDSVRLLEALTAEANKANRTPLALLQINISHEEQKQGFDAAELIPHQATLIRNEVPIVGLMGMAAYADDPEAARPAFRRLRELRDQLQQAWDLPLAYLSMGMSGDFEVAIEEGATHIRLGTTLFEGLENE